MHEYSIVQSLIELCEENARVHNAVKINKVTIKIGILSGVEPYLLKTAFDAFKEKTICEFADMVMNIQPIVIKCRRCSAISRLKKIRYLCRKCGSTDVKVIDGEDMYLMRLEME